MPIYSDTEVSRNNTTWGFEYKDIEEAVRDYRTQRPENLKLAYLSRIADSLERIAERLDPEWQEKHKKEIEKALLEEKQFQEMRATRRAKAIAALPRVESWYQRVYPQLEALGKHPCAAAKYFTAEIRFSLRMVRDPIDPFLQKRLSQLIAFPDLRALVGTQPCFVGKIRWAALEQIFPTLPEINVPCTESQFDEADHPDPEQDQG